MKKDFSQVLLLIQCFLLAILSNVAFAESGIGGVADNMMQPVGLMADFVYSACVVIGGSFVFASLIKYMEHRRSPLMVPISTPIFLLIAGIVLLSMPLLSLYTDYSVRYSLFR